MRSNKSLLRLWRVSSFARAKRSSDVRKYPDSWILLWNAEYNNVDNVLLESGIQSRNPESHLLYKESRIQVPPNPRLGILILDCLGFPTDGAKNKNCSITYMRDIPRRWERLSRPYPCSFTINNTNRSTITTREGGLNRWTQDHATLATLPYEKQPHLNPMSFSQTRAMDLNLLQPVEDWLYLSCQYQSRCWNPPSPVTQFTLFLSCPTIPNIVRPPPSKVMGSGYPSAFPFVLAPHKKNQSSLLAI